MMDAWNSIDKADEDALLLDLEKAGKDLCPWGFATTNSEGFQIHIYRNSVAEDSYSALITKNHSENSIDLVKEGFIAGLINAFFTNWNALLPDVK